MSVGFSGLGGTTVEKVALAVEATGTQALADLGIALATVNTDLRNLSDDYRNGVISITEFEEATGALIRQQKDLQQQVGAASYALKHGADALRDVAGDGATSLNKLTNSAFQVAFALDDVQYGIQGIANNIPGIIGVFTPSGPIGAGISAGAAALALYAQHWEKLADLMLVGATNTDHASVALRENAEAAILARKETEQLTEAKRRQSTVDTLLALKSTEEKKRTDLVTKAIAEAGGGDDVRSLLVQSFQADGTGARDQAREDFIARALATGEWQESDPYIQGKIREMNEANQAEDIRRAEQMLREATESEQGLTALRNRVLANGNVFGGTNLAMDLGEATIQGQFNKQVREQRIIERNAEQKRLDREAEAERRRAEREKQREADAREKAQDKLEQTEVGRDLTSAIPGFGALGASNTVVEALGRAGKDAEREQKALAQRIQAEAREFQKDLDQELSGALLNRVQRGESLEQASAALVPQVARRIVASPSFDRELNSTAVAQRIVESSASDIGGGLAGEMGRGNDVRQGAAALFEQNRDKADAEANREANRASKEQEAAFAAQQAALFQQQTGANPQLSKQFGDRTLQNFKRLGDLGAAQQAAYAELIQQMNAVSQRIGQLEANQARLMGSARTMRGNFLRNRFPGR